MKNLEEGMRLILSASYRMQTWKTPKQRSGLDFHWLAYIDMEAYKSLVRDTQEIGRMIDHMINHPEKFARNW
jgi:hypothetical protein